MNKYSVAPVLTTSAVSNKHIRRLKSSVHFPQYFSYICPPNQHKNERISSFIRYAILRSKNNTLQSTN